MKNGINVVIFVCVFSALVSCGQKTQTVAQVVNKDSIAKVDSENVLNKIAKSITDTLPEFLNTKFTAGSKYVSFENERNAIVVYYRPNGKIMSVYSSYHAHTLTLEKQYDTLGNISEEGFTVAGGENIRIGKWVLYAENGGIDTVIDYDTHFKITYDAVQKIIAKRNWSVDDAQIRYWPDAITDGTNGEHVVKRTDYWEIVHHDKQDSLKSIVLRVDAFTGKEKIVKEETFQLCN